MSVTDKAACPVPCPSCNGTRLVHYSSWDEPSPCPQCAVSAAGRSHRFVPVNGSPFCADCGWHVNHPNHVDASTRDNTDGPVSS